MQGHQRTPGQGMSRGGARGQPSSTEIHGGNQLGWSWPVVPLDFNPV